MATAREGWAALRPDRQGGGVRRPCTASCRCGPACGKPSCDWAGASWRLGSERAVVAATGRSSSSTVGGVAVAVGGGTPGSEGGGRPLSGASPRPSPSSPCAAPVQAVWGLGGKARTTVSPEVPGGAEVLEVRASDSEDEQTLADLMARAAGAPALLVPCPLRPLVALVGSLPWLPQVQSQAMGDFGVPFTSAADTASPPSGQSLQQLGKVAVVTRNAFMQLLSTKYGSKSLPLQPIVQVIDMARTGQVGGN